MFKISKKYFILFLHISHPSRSPWFMSDEHTIYLRTSLQFLVPYKCVHIYAETLLQPYAMYDYWWCWFLLNASLGLGLVWCSNTWQKNNVREVYTCIVIRTRITNSIQSLKSLCWKQDQKFAFPALVFLYPLNNRKGQILILKRFQLHFSFTNTQ